MVVSAIVSEGEAGYGGRHGGAVWVCFVTAGNTVSSFAIAGHHTGESIEAVLFFQSECVDERYGVGCGFDADAGLV